jgi:hypothetical protein
MRALWLTLIVALAASTQAQAFTTTIGPGQRAVFLQVGTGTINGGNFQGGGTPQNNGTINQVSVSVPSASLGTGSQAMTSNSTVANSPYDGFTFCTLPAQVYVGGFYRVPGGAGPNATLAVTTPANLTNAGGATIPFAQISWVSGGNGDGTPTIPSGAFNGGTVSLLSLVRNTWFESCLAFSYANSQFVPAGTFTGRAVYTLVSP